MGHPLAGPLFAVPFSLFSAHIPDYRNLITSYSLLTANK